MLDNKERLAAIQNALVACGGLAPTGADEDEIEDHLYRALKARRPDLCRRLNGKRSRGRPRKDGRVGDIYVAAASRVLDEVNSIALARGERAPAQLSTLERMFGEKADAWRKRIERAKRRRARARRDGT